MAATAIPQPMLTHPALAWAHPVVQEWFLTRFGSPTEPQLAGWPAILAGDPTLISAPTGSGKTLAAFLVCIDRLLRAAIAGQLQPHTQIVYISPLKALSNDVQKNLDGPLAEIQQLAIDRGHLWPRGGEQIRTGVRTGDTLAKHRAAMLRHPPHILVTTPESLYILLTAGKSRQNLTHVHTVIVDEIHALAGNKRGSHLSLSLERLEALVCAENHLTSAPGRPIHDIPTIVSGEALLPNRAPQRIGLSATQNPIELVASFLTGARPPATIIQVGQRRTLDLAIEVPSDELGSIATNAMWTEIFDKLAAFAGQHRSTLVFVNTRRLVEKISFELSSRLGEDAVAAHHGSLSRALRLDAEQRLKDGQIKILVATASLELGIDIGSIDLVCQIATTRAVAVAMQRVGRAGHWRGAVPKGRFFATTRDDLLEQAALLRKMTAGELDRLEVPEAPADVLMQQVVASVGAESWDETALYNVLRRAWPYRNLSQSQFAELLALLHNGIESTRGRYGAYLLRDRVQGHLHARRGARSIAISNGGAIPDTSLFAVMLQPENVQIATLDEHFAVDSSAGDVVLLGNTSWRIQRVDPQGKVLVEDAHGAPPSIPFWEGEAPQRTAVLSDAVSDLRSEIDLRTRSVSPSAVRATHPQVADCIAWLTQACFLPTSGARQLIAYVVAGRAALGAVPTKSTIIAERFFDDGGGQQLIIHAPFGGRINKAWGLALRKRFCRGFNFELQAAATDNGINISLAEQHSFPLADVFHFLTEHTARELLEQACIPSPLFKNRWRWAAGRSLQLLRMSKGKRVAPQVQRTRSDDLLASVFPHASACPETMTGDIEIPDHPLVREVMRDTLSEAMDIDGLIDILRGISSGTIRCLAVDTPVPSVFAHELVNAMPYAFLDEAGAEERRARATSLRRALPDAVSEAAGRLDPAAIASVRAQLQPDIRDEHELHDLLLQLIALPAPTAWTDLFARLQSLGRAHLLTLNGHPFWLATERLPEAQLLWPNASLVSQHRQHSGAPSLEPRVSSTSHNSGTPSLQARVSYLAEEEGALAPEVCPSPNPPTRDAATLALTQGWLQLLGPTTSAHLAALVHLHPRSIHQAMLAMEMQGLALRGVFDRPAPAEDAPHEIEWCERRILHRIHRLTLGTRRKQVEPVSPAVFMHWLLGWHHLAPDTQLSGEEAVLAAIEQLEGFEAPAIEWERSLLPARVANYSPQWLDNLCLAGVVAWGRISPHPAWTASSPSHNSGTPRLVAPCFSLGSARVSYTQNEVGALAPEGKPRRVIPTSAAPITFYLRDSSDWLHHALAAKCIDEATLTQSLSPESRQLRQLLATRGAAFTTDLQHLSGLNKLQTSTALWELATAGLASADGFDQLRAMMDPRRRSAATPQAPTSSLRKRASARTTAGRWSLLLPSTDPETATNHIVLAKQTAAALDAHARILLCRYGVLFREILARESNAPKWRDLVPVLRRLEARGELRGGRFVSGPFGEQYALPEVVDQLRTARRQLDASPSTTPIAVAAADPLNLAGILVPGDRVPAVPGHHVLLLNGVVFADPTAPPPKAVVRPSSTRGRTIADLLRADAAPPPRPPAILYPGLPEIPGLFS